MFLKRQKGDNSAKPFFGKEKKKKRNVPLPNQKKPFLPVPSPRVKKKKKLKAPHFNPGPEKGFLPPFLCAKSA